LGRPLPPIPHMSYSDVMSRFGSDKPDMRYGLELQDISSMAQRSSAKMLQQGALQGGAFAINAKGLAGQLTEGEKEALQVEARQAGAKGVLLVELLGGSWKSPIAKHLSEADQEALQDPDSLGAEEGDLLMISVGKRMQCLGVLGKLRIQVAGLMQQRGLLSIDPKQEAWLWVEDFPLVLEADGGGWKSCHHPFTAPARGQVEALLEGEKLETIRSQHYDLVLNGMEVGGGSIRIHHAELQRYVMQDVLGLEEAHVEDCFAHLLEALASGCPPHGGFAIGFDRLVAHMAGVNNIREVIAFPKTATGQELMTGAPGPVESTRLHELHWSVN